MRVTGMGWAGAIAEQYEASQEFFTEQLGLPLQFEAKKHAISRFRLPSGQRLLEKGQERARSQLSLATISMAIGTFASAKGFETRHSDQALFICRLVADTQMPPVPRGMSANLPTIDLDKGPDEQAWPM